jgi:predicted metal-dependent peptidase
MTTSSFTAARERIGTFRIASQHAMPYLGTYVYSLIPVESPGIGTMAVDRFGRLYYDPVFVESTSRECGTFTVLHEALHVVFDHAAMAERVVGKQGTATQYKAWNFAVDMVVNGILCEFISHAPEGIITAERFGLPTKLTAIEYYHLLLDANEQAQRPQTTPSAGEHDLHEGTTNDPDVRDDSAGEGSGDNNSSTGHTPGNGESDRDQSGEDSGTRRSANSSSNEEIEAADNHSGGSCSDGLPRHYELPPDDSWEDRELAMAYDLENECAAVGWGSVPGAIRKSLNAKLRPQPDPFAVLRAACARAVSSPVGAPDYTYRRISRRQVEGQPRLKGVQKLTPNAVIVLDTSGSMLDAETEAKALTVVASGLRRLRSVRVIGGDMNITSNKQVSSLKQLEWLGGGGTSMKTVLEAVDKEHRPDAIVLITDGETDWPERLRAKLVVALTQPTEAPSWATAIMVGKQGDK